MVTFYDLKDQVQNGTLCIDDNKLFFVQYTIPVLNSDVDKLLSHVDNCKFINNDRFKDRNGVDLYWEDLSTGGMTILNAYYYPDIAFSGIECGLNAVRDLTLLPRGIIYKSAPWPSEGDKFTAMYRGKVYTDYEEYMNDED